MKWTKFTKGIFKIILTIVVIASSIVGIALLAEGQFAFGIILLFGGVITSLISFSIVMVLCEISDNLYNLRKSLSGDSSNENDDEEEEEDNTDEDEVDGINNFGNGIRL